MVCVGLREQYRWYCLFAYDMFSPHDAGVVAGGGADVVSGARSVGGAEALDPGA